jgi:hypothetical protein
MAFCTRLEQSLVAQYLIKARLGIAWAVAVDNFRSFFLAA